MRLVAALVAIVGTLVAGDAPAAPTAPPAAPYGVCVTIDAQAPASIEPETVCMSNDELRGYLLAVAAGLPS